MKFAYIYIYIYIYIFKEIEINPISYKYKSVKIIFRHIYNMPNVHFLTFFMEIDGIY